MIEGPKWCGKTTTAEQIAGSILYMADPEKEKQNRTMAEISPGRLLKGKFSCCSLIKGCSTTAKRDGNEY